jgi:hypothetical protein
MCMSLTVAYLACDLVPCSKFEQTICSGIAHLTNLVHGETLLSKSALLSTTYLIIKALNNQVYYCASLDRLEGSPQGAWHSNGIPSLIQCAVFDKDTANKGFLRRTAEVATSVR